MTAPRSSRLLRLLRGGALALALAGGARAPAATLVTGAVPEGFEALATEQRVVADLVFGGRDVGQFEIETAPGRLRFVHPDQVVAALPGLLDPATVEAALSGTLDPHETSGCTAGARCDAAPEPDPIAIRFDPRRFQVELLVAPRLLAVRPVTAQPYLTPEGRALSLVDTVAAAMAGGDGRAALMSIRNRAVLAHGATRLVSETGYSTGLGATVDTLVAETDRPGLRGSAGLFYAPGPDLVGRRRILGVGIGSQFDTRIDRGVLMGSPLVVFLSQRARVDLLVEGRLVSSGVYEAGNQSLDTEALPEGSYPIDLRIQDLAGGTRTERRFFTKSARIPPTGRTLFHADAGLLAFARPGAPLSVSRTPVATMGAARRLGTHLAIDAEGVALSGRAMVEVGATWLACGIQARGAALVSSAGDLGLIAQVASAGAGPFGVSLDLRQLRTHDGRPLVPLDAVSRDLFANGDAAFRQAQYGAARVTQLVGTLSYRVRGVQIGLSTYVRREAGRPLSYAMGPAAHWALLRRGPVQLSADGSVAQTERGRSVAAGLRLQIFGRRGSISATGGVQSAAPGGGHGGGAYGALDAAMQRPVAGGMLDLSAGVQRGAAGTLVRAGLDERSALGALSATVAHRTGGGDADTQYALGFQTAVAATRGAVALGAREQGESVIAVSLDGGASDAPFEVLVNEVPQGRVRAGGRVTVAVSPYRRYRVRVRPVGTALVAFDARARSVDVLPGSVAALHWSARRVAALFGRLVWPDGRPVADAHIVADADAVADTDDAGWFQLQAAADARLTVRDARGRACDARLSAGRAGQSYTALGDVACVPQPMVAGEDPAHAAALNAARGG